ncbi:Cell wall-associated hydrolase, NlpC family [Actinoplanes regularis]|uniref:Cell wall-associated hydrolase, NlpC family n=1 Tax=Actinoplanes regularis TaxID=52697 RepID=A0A239BCW7_9ACTN|nr:Cell wall-associated hydrolase, NlpC family [Actinoplanes regularis]
MVALTALAITTSGATAAHAAPSEAQLKKQIETASNKLEDVSEAYNKTVIAQKKTQADIVKLNASLKPTKEALAQATTRMSKIATSSYMTGRVGPAEVLLSSNQRDLLQRMSYLEQLSQSNQLEIDNYTETTQTFADKQAALKTQQTKQGLQAKELNAQKATYKKDLEKLYDMREDLYGSATESTGSYTGPIPKISGDAGVAVTFAFKQIGKPYGFGDAGPGSYDCSGLTMAAWAAAGHSLPHSAAQQKNKPHVKFFTDKSQLAAGDLVFYRSGGHVAIYVGDGMIIDAPSAGRDVLHRTINIMTPDGYGRVL